MSCAPFSQIPTPPTTLASCAVPVGGSNSSILDACCNGHINAITTYSAPDEDTNSEDNDGCFQYCVTDSADIVRGCLAEKMEAYEKGMSMFECFNVASVRKGGNSEDGSYRSLGVSNGGGLGWAARVMISLGIVGAIVGVV